MARPCPAGEPCDGTLYSDEKMHRPARVLILLLPLAACNRGRRTDADTTFVRGGEVDLGAPVSARELALFAPLPAVMAAPGVSRSAAEIALGRRLFHESVLSDGHDVSCNSCHALNGYGADGRKVSFGDLGHAG